MDEIQGIAESIDHQLARPNLGDKVEFEYVRVNAGFVDRASDHDPSTSRVDMRS